MPNVLVNLNLKYMQIINLCQKFRVISLWDKKSSNNMIITKRTTKKEELLLEGKEGLII